MKWQTKGTQFARKFDPVKLKKAIVSRMAEKLEFGPPPADRVQCLAEVADKILDLLHTELFAEPEPTVDTLVSPAVEAAVAASVGVGSEDFERVARQVVQDVRFGYLSSNLQMVNALGAAIAQRDTGSGDHNYRVTLYAVRLGEAIGLNPRQMQGLIKGALLHDIGKISIADRILLKDDKLTDKERILMRNHPLFGTYITKNVKWLEDAYDVVLYHHEKWDGSGYLAGLHGDGIPLNARIFAVVDVFDALASERPYKQAYSYQRTIEYMAQQSGTHFDPELFEQFGNISREIYDEIGCGQCPILEDMMTRVIKEHFGVDPNDTRIRSKYDIL